MDHVMTEISAVFPYSCMIGNVMVVSSFSSGHLSFL